MAEDLSEFAPSEAVFKLAPLETLAVTLFESFMRQQASEGRGKSIQDWCDIPQESRIFWRNKAVEMTAEFYDLRDFGKDA